VGRGGIVRDPVLHRQVLLGVANAAQGEMGYAVRDACVSPITGAEGNREFFLHLVLEGAPLDRDRIEGLVRKAVET
jgi:23S rRNA (cytidine1920-2'-O)/16S rRNA (cytidine1409-2'-O)-methyltransferase